MSTETFVKGQRVLCNLGLGTVEAFETFINHGRNSIKVDSDPFDGSTTSPCRVVVALDDPTNWVGHNLSQDPNPYIFRRELMPAPMKTGVMNTGRGYSPEGQFIAWALIEEIPETPPRVVFCDITREVYGVIQNYDISSDGEESRIGREVLYAYDRGRYHQASRGILLDFLIKEAKKERDK